MRHNLEDLRQSTDELINSPQTTNSQSQHLNNNSTLNLKDNSISKSPISFTVVQKESMEKVAKILCSGNQR